MIKEKADAPTADDPTDAPSPNASSPNASERIDDVRIIDPADGDEGRIVFELTDGRVLSLPLSWSWRLQEATPKERKHFEISPSGYGVHWPDVDEDLSARGALRGTPAPKPGSAPPSYMPGDSHMPGDWSAPRVKQLRKQLGLSQDDFARRMGVRQATVSDWETGKQEPSRMARRLLDRIAGPRPILRRKLRPDCRGLIVAA